jgi:peptidoglycan/xylan/chitin deacetylase (PgdA/CDA1 family)
MRKRVGIFGLIARVQRKPIVFVFHDVTDADWFENAVDEISLIREVLPLEEVVSKRQNGTCALTFDDGLRSVSDVVHPVLRNNKLPYTVFLCTDVLTGGPVPWFMRIDHLAAAIDIEPLRTEWRFRRECVQTRYELTVALKEVPLDSILSGLARLEQAYGIDCPTADALFLSPEQLRRLAAENVSFGSHTRRHPILSKLSASEQRNEIETSRDDVEKLTGTRPSQFAYPNGSALDFDRGTMSILRDSGYTHAYTTIQRHLSSKNEPFALPRIGLDAGDLLIRRAAKQLTPWLSRNHAVERRIRACVNGGLNSASGKRECQ